MHTLTIKTFEELTTAELYELLKARFQVFVMEQRCFYLDMDNIDYRSLHFLLQQPDGRLLAYARLFREEEPGAWHVGRMLTTVRRAGHGRRLMQALIDRAWQEGATVLRMEAQVHAVDFYRQLGFHTVGSEFDEACVPHIRMEQTRR